MLLLHEVEEIGFIGNPISSLWSSSLSSENSNDDSPPCNGGRTREFMGGDFIVWLDDRTVRGTCLGEDLAELEGVPMKDEVVDSEVDVCAALVIEPAGEAPYPYIENEDARALFAPRGFPRWLGGEGLEGERIDNELRLRQSISNVGGDSDASLRSESESGLKEASFVEEASDLSSVAQNGRGGLGGDHAEEETEPVGILMEFAGRFRPLEDSITPGRPDRIGLDMNGTGFLGFSLKQLGAVLILALSERDFSSELPRLTIGGDCHDLLT